MRLVDGSSYNEGRVEVYYSGRWGTVCNEGWDDKYASLVCAQLGFGSSGKLAKFNPGTGNVLLENVLCSVNDTVLASCGHYGVDITVRCDHSKDVGIKCYGMFVCTYSSIRKLSYNAFFALIIRYGNNSSRNYANH